MNGLALLAIMLQDTATREKAIVYERVMHFTDTKTDLNLKFVDRAEVFEEESRRFECHVRPVRTELDGVAVPAAKDAEPEIILMKRNFLAEDVWSADPMGWLSVRALIELRNRKATAGQKAEWKAPEPFELAGSAVWGRDANLQTVNLRSLSARIPGGVNSANLSVTWTRVAPVIQTDTSRKD